MKRFERSNGLDTALYKNYLYLFFSTRPSDRAQIFHACADRYSHLKFFFNLTHPTPGGFRGYLCVWVATMMWDDVVLWDVCGRV